MNFGKALELVKGDQRVRRPTWPVGVTLGMTRGRACFADHLPYPQRTQGVDSNLFDHSKLGDVVLPKLRLTNAAAVDWVPVDSDVFAEDWEVTE